MKKRHFQSKNGVDAEPKEKRKKEQQSITETSSGARASKSKDYPDIVEQPLSEDVVRYWGKKHDYLFLFHYCQSIAAVEVIS